jgi:uncharacterized protein (TIGR00369 family)
MSGYDYLQAMIRGELPPPPVASLMNMQPGQVEVGRAIFYATPKEYHYNPIGTVHGGFAAGLRRSVAGVGYTTVELHVNLVRPISLNTGMMKCDANVIHTGRRVATAEAKLTDASGTTTCMIFGGE